MGRSGLAAIGASLAIAGCGGGGHTNSNPPRRPSASLPAAAPPTLRLSSPAFSSGSRIPEKYTCAGRDISPPLRWTGVPANAKALALLMIDRDAPGGPFTHWALAGIPPTTHGIGAGQATPGAIPGRNGFGKIAYGGPCPPAGKLHHYVIELLALPRSPRVSPGFASGALARERPLAAGVLRGTYSRG